VHKNALLCRGVALAHIFIFFPHFLTQPAASPQGGVSPTGTPQPPPVAPQPPPTPPAPPAAPRLRLTGGASQIGPRFPACVSGLTICRYDSLRLEAWTDELFACP